jgi:hypothetical protein
MTCETVRENLWSYHHHQISAGLFASIRSHLETCSECALELERFKQVDGVLEGFSAIEVSPYFDQRLDAKLNEIERASSGWGWAALWLKDSYLWTFVTLFLVAMGLWLGFRRQQNEELRSMEQVIRLQDGNLRQQRSPEDVPSLPQASGQVAVGPGPLRPVAETEDAIPDEDRAVVENLELLQDYDFLKDLADMPNGDGVKTN